MRITVIKPEGTFAPYIMEAYAEAFRELRHTVSFQPWGKPIINPDLIVSYNLSGVGEVEAGMTSADLGIPTILLHFDCPFFLMQKGIIDEFRRHPHLYTHFVWDETYVIPLATATECPVYPIEHAVNRSWFPLRIPVYKYDASFVGTIPDPFPLRAKRVATTPELARSFFDQILASKMARPSNSLLGLWAIHNPEQALNFRGKEIDFTDPNQLALFYCLHEEGTALYRTYFTDHPLVTRLSGIDYRKKLEQVYAHSKINIHLSSWQNEKATAGRVFDVAGVGGFLLADGTEGNRKYLDQAQIYETKEALFQKIDYFLVHEKERLELALAMREKVLKEGTYKHRAEYVLTKVPQQSFPKSGAELF